MEEIQAPTALVIKVADYEPTKGIFIESIGVRGFSIKKGTLKVNCVLDISAESNEKNIKIQTSKVCVNSTKAVINLNFQSKTVAIYPNSVFSLPLSWCETPISPLLVGHEGNADLFQEGSIQLDEKTWIITELGIYKTLSGINQTIIQFKAPFTYRNLLPCPVSVFYNNLESPLFDLSPGESQSVLTIDPSTDEMIYRFQLQIENEYMLETD